MQISASSGPPDRVDVARSSPSTVGAGPRSTAFAALLGAQGAPAGDATPNGARTHVTPARGTHANGALPRAPRGKGGQPPAVGTMHRAAARESHGAHGGSPTHTDDDGASGPPALAAAAIAERDALEALEVLGKSARHAAQLGVPSALSAHSPASGAAPPAATGPAGDPANATAGTPRSLEELVPSLVRKIAWSGDGRNGALRLEVGAGALKGASFFVEASAGRVHVTLTPPADLDSAGAAAWRERIATRLTARGIDLDAVNLE